MKRSTLLLAAVASLAFAMVADAQCWGGRRCRSSCQPACGSWNSCGTMNNCGWNNCGGCNRGCGRSWSSCNTGCNMGCNTACATAPCGGCNSGCAMVQPCGQTFVAYSNPCCNVLPCGGMVVQGNVMPGSYVITSGQPIMMTGTVVTASVSSPMPAPGQVVQASSQEKKDGATTPATTTNATPMVVVPQNGMIIQTGMVQPCGNMVVVPTGVNVVPANGCYDNFYSQPCNNYYPAQRYSRVRYVRGNNCGGCY